MRNEDDEKRSDRGQSPDPNIETLEIEKKAWLDFVDIPIA